MTHSKESFVRWQSTTIAQFGVALNLLIALSTASLGFALSQFKDALFLHNCWGRWLLSASVILLGTSILLGLCCTFTRLCDFRKTAAVARLRQKALKHKRTEGQINRLLYTRRQETRRLGMYSWRLLCWETIAFLAGVIAIIFAFEMAYSSAILLN